MNNDTNRPINNDGSYNCSIIHNTFVCYLHISDEENNIKITIIITEEEGNNEERNKKEKED